MAEENEASNGTGKPIIQQMRRRRKLMRPSLIKIVAFAGVIVSIGMQFKMLIVVSQSPATPTTAFNKSDEKKTAVATTTTTTKTILYVQDANGWPGEMLANKNIFGQCPVSSCAFSFNHSKLEKADAVLVHGVRHTVPYHLFKSTHRRPDQRFVFMAVESAAYEGNRVVPRRSDYDSMPENRDTPDPYDNFFNWTMTHLTNSDVFAPYGRFREIGQPAPGRHPYDPHRRWIPYDEGAFMSSLKEKPQKFRDLASRPNGVAWVASNCNSLSGREGFLRELKRHTDVGTFGKCGENKTACDRGGNCFADIARQYKFYFAAENSVCDDYVTEKFFTRVDDHVALVFGGANYSSFAPPHSFIDARDFASPLHLARYLNNMTEAEYLSYFWWKDHYEVVTSKTAAYCELCSMLHGNHPVKTYPDLQGWWQGSQQCKQSVDSQSPATPTTAFNKSDEKKTAVATTTTTTKTILYVQDANGWPGEMLANKNIFGQCPVSSCAFSFNHSKLEKADAVLVHGVRHTVPYHLFKSTHRRPDQRFVFMAVESAAYEGNRVVPRRSDYDSMPENRDTPDPYDNFFNWTMTHLTNSDVFAPYGRFREIGQPAPGRHPYDPHRRWIPYDEGAFMSSLKEKPQKFRDLASRPNGVAWVASNCNSLSGREGFLRELKRHTDVGTFGKCGENKTACDRGGNCFADIARQYKFYFAAENSVCDDYVTEKFFTRVDDHVALVFGGANYSSFAPPHSFIDARDFASPLHLARYLNNMTEAEYLSYFWWKDHYEVVTSKTAAYCELCSMLHGNHPVKTYPDLQGWWQGSQQCKQSVDSQSPATPTTAFNKSDEKKTAVATTTTTTKTILYVQDANGWPGEMLANKNIFGQCPVSSCAFSFNHSKLEKADAVLVHGVRHTVPYHLFKSTHRRPDQRFVFMAVESAAYEGNRVVPRRSDYDSMPENRDTPDPYDNFFNWTMTHLTNSDVFAPYGRFREIGQPAPGRHPYDPHRRWIPYDEGAFMSSLKEKPQKFRDLASRPNGVAWVASNCNSLSGREGFLRELKRHTDVGTFGKCGENKTACDRGGNCFADIARQYKFYFAAENSVCDDYVTEKFFTRVDDHVALVFGGANYSSFAPPHSFIDARDFASPLHLARYLNNMTEAEYLSYFWWKDHYEVVTSKTAAYCELCSMLHGNHPVKTYPDLQGWWQGSQQCKQSLD